MKTQRTIAACLILAAVPLCQAESQGLIRITRSGTTHLLSQDHIGAILIDASGVTLDCRHHKLYVLRRGDAPERLTQGAAVKVGMAGRAGRSHIIVRNCVVQGADGAYRYGILAENASDVTIEDNTLAGRFDAQAFKLAGGGAFTVARNVVHGSAGGGGEITVIGDNVHITGNTLQLTGRRGTAAAIRASGTSVSIVDNTLTGCQVAESVGIGVWNAAGGTVLGNTITDFVVPLEVDETAEGVVVDDNLII